MLEDHELDLLGRQAKAHHDRWQRALKDVENHQNSFVACLIKARQALGSDRFGPWLDKHGIPRSTAYEKLRFERDPSAREQANSRRAEAHRREGAFAQWAREQQQRRADAEAMRRASEARTAGMGAHTNSDKPDVEWSEWERTRHMTKCCSEALKYAEVDIEVREQVFLLLLPFMHKRGAAIPLTDGEWEVIIKLAAELQGSALQKAA
jgi:hypothetical protein